jgi:2,5-diamino-6-(ribosylamino)-4(3H)-pyrimidinone 5'-phosphate reductase
MKKPFVVIFNSASVDGRLAVSREKPLLHGDKRWQAMEEWSASKNSNSILEQLKTIHNTRITLEGSGSFVPENVKSEPLPSYKGDKGMLYQDYLPEAVVHRPGHRGWFIAVDGRGRVRSWIKDGSVFGEEYAGTHLLVLAGFHTPPEYLAYLRNELIPYIIAGDGQIDLRLCLEKLYDKLNVSCMISTAGGRLNGALIRNRLVDEVNIEFLPGVIGGFTAPSLFDSPDLGPNEMPVRLNLISVTELSGGSVWLRYRVVSNDN